MATCTPIYGLAQVECSDRPCDVNDTLCQFANDVEAQLDALDAVVNRTATTVPMVILERNDPFTIVVGSNPSLPEFQSVLVDTDNMADLTTLSRGITIQTPGIYYTWIYLRGTATIAGSFPEVAVTILPGVLGQPFQSSFFNAELNLIGPTAGWIMAGTAGAEMNYPAVWQLFPRFSSSGLVNDSMTFTSYMFGASFLSDLP